MRLHFLTIVCLAALLAFTAADDVNETSSAVTTEGGNAGTSGTGSVDAAGDEDVDANEENVEGEDASAASGDVSGDHEVVSDTNEDDTTDATVTIENDDAEDVEDWDSSSYSPSTGRDWISGTNIANAEDEKDDNDFGDDLIDYFQNAIKKIRGIPSSLWNFLGRYYLFN